MAVIEEGRGAPGQNRLGVGDGVVEEVGVGVGVEEAGDEEVAGHIDNLGLRTDQLGGGADVGDPLANHGHAVL